MSKRILYQENGALCVIIPVDGSGLDIEQVAAGAVPAGLDYKIVDLSAVPSDRLFRDAWELSGQAISVNVAKAKDVAHSIRRRARSAEFAPLDIKATIPGESEAAEAGRQAIRDKYASMQDNINAASSAEDVKSFIATII